MEWSAYNAVLHCGREPSPGFSPGPNAPWGVGRSRCAASPARVRWGRHILAQRAGTEYSSLPETEPFSLTCVFENSGVGSPRRSGRGRAFFFFFFGGYFKNPHSHRCLPCPSFPWARTREWTHACFSPLVPVDTSGPLSRGTRGEPLRVTHPRLCTHQGLHREVTNCRGLSFWAGVGDHLEGWKRFSSRSVGNQKYPRAWKQ